MPRRYIYEWWTKFGFENKDLKAGRRDRADEKAKDHMKVVVVTLSFSMHHQEKDAHEKRER
jgi:hypothetical protein